MKSNKSWRIRLAQILLGAAILFALVAIRGAKAGDEHVHLVTDWSHRHLMYSAPRNLMERFELSTHQRYVQQWMRRNAEKRGDRDEWRWRRAHEDQNHLHGDWSMDMGASATVGAGNYPAKFSFDPTSSNCANPAPPAGQQPDFVVYSTSLAGSISQASIVAFDNLYSGCNSGNFPTTYWAYNLGSGPIMTSPILSLDGSQVAFVQNTSSAATLVILRWKANTGTLAIPMPLTPGSCTALTAPCITTVTFSTANSDTTPANSFSSPFYDYANDTLFVGDDFGFLHKFTGIFLGTPAEVVCTASTTTAGCTLPAGTNIWPANLDSPFGHLNSPVFAESANQVLVTDSSGVFYSVDPTIGGIFVTGFDETPRLANTGFDDGPLVDLTTGNIYLFARADNTSSVTGVIQIPMPANPAALHNVTGTEAIVSNSVTNPASAFYIGAFDNAYYTSGGTGNLFACSTSGTDIALWKVPIAAGVMGTPVVGPTLTTANAACSPITEFQNGATDRMFLSVAATPVTGAPINCPAGSGCIMSFNITNTSTWSTATTTAATASVTGGTSAIIIDNASSAGGASQVYFTPLADQSCAGSGGVGTGTGGCAIQASQSGLN
jgi:hypothetical protein